MELEPPPTQANHRIGQSAGGLQDLRARFTADDGLQFAHQVGIGMRADAPNPADRSVLVGSETQSRIASSMAARSVRSPLVTGSTVAPSRRMRPTFGAWRSMSTSPMYTTQGSPTRAQAAAEATPCWPGTGLGHDALGADALGQQRLADGIVDLVRAGVREVLALQPHLRAPARGQRRGIGQCRGSPGPGRRARGRAPPGIRHCADARARPARGDPWRE